MAFLRTRIEFIDQFFGPGEVADIWLTFSDPQPKDEKGTKRITSGKFIERYRKFLAPGGSVKVKSDSKLLYALSKEEYQAAGYPFLHDSDDVYGASWTPWTPTCAKLWKSRRTMNSAGWKRARTSTSWKSFLRRCEGHPRRSFV